MGLCSPSEFIRTLAGPWYGLIVRTSMPSAKAGPEMSIARRGIQPDHFGVLALPVAEFLAVRHGTSYLGYSQQSSKEAAHPFFASRAHHTRMRAAGEQGREMRWLLVCSPARRAVWV